MAPLVVDHSSMSEIQENKVRLEESPRLPAEDCIPVAPAVQSKHDAERLYRLHSTVNINSLIR